MTAADRPVPGAADALLLVGRTLDELTRVQLPRLHALCGKLRGETLAADAAPLVDALQEHLGAAQALAFELLIPRGLRAGTSRADEAAFRTQVQRLVAATEATWTELRTYVGASAGAAARADVLLSEFVMQARAVQRRTATCDPPLERLRMRMESEGGRLAGSPAAGDEQDQLAARLQALQRRIEVFGGACEAARNVRRLMHAVEQERASLHAALQKLAHTLGGGLLERLRPMVAGLGHATRDEVEAAQAAREALHLVLANATAGMRRLTAVRSHLVTALDATGDAIRPPHGSTAMDASLLA